jgi:hypothetical protein
MAIGKIERQPCRLLALADKYLVGGICQFVVGRSHCIASSSSLIGIKSIGFEHTSSCDAIETGQRAFEWIEKVASDDQSDPQTSPKVADEPASATIHRRISVPVVHWCNTWRTIAAQTQLRMSSSLVIRFAGDQD